MRPRGGVINLDLNNIIIDPIRHRIENSGTYNIWKDNSRKIWLALYEDFPQVYGLFNRFNSGMSKYLPVANDKRSISSSYIREKAIGHLLLKNLLNHRMFIFIQELSALKMQPRHQI